MNSTLRKQTRVLNHMTVPFTLTFITLPEVDVTSEIVTVSQKVDHFLAQVDQKFSPFKVDSDVSRFQRHELDLLTADATFQTIYALSMDAKQFTQGGFNAYYHGYFDPTGLVKGWAIETARQQFLQPLLDHPWFIAVGINGGGDMQLATNDGEFNWEIGMENPTNLQRILATYHLTNDAVATSGFNKRGLHSERPAANDFRQLTIIGDSLTTADIWATAGLSMAATDFKRLSELHQLSGMVVYDDLSVQAFAGGEWFDAQKL